MTIKCLVCQSTFNSLRKLCKHVRDIHCLTSQSYYDSYIKRDDEGMCEYCENPTQFTTIGLGYRKSCGACKSQKAKDFRKLQKSNLEKHQQFVDKVRKNQSQIWKERKKSGRDVSIRQKIGQSIHANNSILTEEQRKEKFGWLNKLSDEQKEVWKQTVMFKTGAFRWWKTSSILEKNKVIAKRTVTLIDTIFNLVEEANQNPNDYRKYCEAVIILTNITYFRNQHLLDPYGLRGIQYHLDHIYSKKAGFVNRIDPLIISSLHNLRLIPASQNLKKNAKCEITLQELLEKYYE